MSRLPASSSDSGPTLPRAAAAKWDQSRRRGVSRGTFRLMARLAGAQDGVVARREILAAGIDRCVIDRHIGRSELVHVYRAVYSIGHVALSQLGRWRAALLLVGEGACLSHSSAAQIHRLVDDGRFANQGVIHLARRGGGRTGIRPALTSAQPAARIHRIKGLRAQDICHRRGLAVTSVERTLIDLAATLSPRQLESTILRAQRLGLLDVPRLADRLSDGMCGKEGIGMLRELIDGATPAKAKTLSEPEAWMLDLFREYGLPEPRVNEPVKGVAGIKVDFCWLEAKLIVEFDGHAFHSSRQALQRDKGRDRMLQLAGYRVLRYTYEDLTSAPAQVVAEIAAALG